MLGILNIKMKIKLNDRIIKPTRVHNFDAGYDIYSPKRFFVSANSISERINLGIGFEIPKGYVGIISERSSQGAKGIHTIGNIIDYGYTGEIHVTLVNNSNKSYEVETGDRICQLLVLNCLNEDLEVVNKFKETERGDSSHGSSGK